MGDFEQYLNNTIICGILILQEAQLHPDGCNTPSFFFQFPFYHLVWDPVELKLSYTNVMSQAGGQPTGIVFQYILEL